MENIKEIVEKTIEEVKTGVRITVVDLGNMNIKYYSALAKGKFSSRISTDYMAYQEGLNRIEMADGRITYIGIGELSREFNKVERNWTAQLLYAICKANPNIDIIENLHLTLLLPALQMDSKQKMIDSLKGKEFNFKFNGVDKIISIKEMLILPEGFSTFYSLPEADQEKDVLILDLGSRTCNICGMVNGDIEILQTIKLGSFDFYNKIRSQENAKGSDYNEETVIRCINNGIISITDKELGEFLNSILDAIKGYVSIRTYNKIVFTGGCSLMLEKVINKLTKLEEKEIHPDALNSNVSGAYEASKLAWEVA